MLDPEYLDRAGDMVASVYEQIQTEMLEHLCRLLLDQGAEGLGQRGTTALMLLAQTQGPYLMGIINEHAGEVNEAVARTVVDAIERSDRDDADRLGNDEWLDDGMRGDYPRQARMVAQGVASILERDNVDMVQGALDLWNRQVASAVTKTATGSVTAQRAIHEAVREMMRAGISTVTYRDAETGRQTVTNRIDVAVRRHVRTQVAQAGMRRTLDVCGSAGIQLVEVSSHAGARPSHARWQGRVFSLNGPVTVDGVRYGDFYAETGYGKVDGLGGANCRHSFGPYIPGTPRMYGQEPEHPSGLDGDEVYRLQQGQRRRERDIRQTKRELAGAQLIADRDASMANVAEVESLKARLRRQQASMREYIDAANAKGEAPVLQRAPMREWAGDMPKIRKTDASRRTMGEFMDSDGVKRALKDRGISKSAAQRALSAELKAQGIDTSSWRHLSKANQQSIFRKALAAIKGAKKPAGGAHMRNASTFKKKLSGKGMDDAHVAAIASMADRCADRDEKRAFDSALADLKMDSVTSGVALYSPSTGGISLDIDDTAKGFASRPDKAPYQTFFHEFGHYIDHRNGTAGRYASDMADIGATVKREVRDRLEKIKKDKGYKRIDEAKRDLTREIISLYRTRPGEIGGLSDIVQGATNSTCCDYGVPGHRKSYWKGASGMRMLATETFAHFYECTMANPKALETLKMYLPDTYQAFQQMLKGF